jgi:hypothetical protein
VTASYGDHAEKAHAAASAIFPKGQVSNLSPPLVNGARSFCVFPDGSKEGWGESEKGDADRSRFIAWLDRRRYGDGSTPYTWAEVEMGECGSPKGNDGASVRRHYRKGVRVGDDYRGPAELDEEQKAELEALRARSV